MGALAGVAAACFLLVQFLPWGTQHIPASTLEGEGGTITFSASDHFAYTWRYELETGKGHESHGWYSSSWEDGDGNMPDGVRQFRIAAPLLVGGTVATAAAALLSLLAPRDRLVRNLAVAGAFLLLAGTAYSVIGTDSFFDPSLDGRKEWGASFYLAIAGCASALSAAIYGFAARQALVQPGSET